MWLFPWLFPLWTFYNKPLDVTHHTDGVSQNCKLLIWGNLHFHSILIYYDFPIGVTSEKDVLSLGESSECERNLFNYMDIFKLSFLLIHQRMIELNYFVIDFTGRYSHTRGFLHESKAPAQIYQENIEEPRERSGHLFEERWDHDAPWSFSIYESDNLRFERRHVRRARGKCSRE